MSRSSVVPDRGIRRARTPRSVAGVLVGALALAALATDAARATEGPRGVVESVTSRVLAVLANAALSSDEKRQQVESIVYAHVDFETVSRLVLARHWRRFSAGQQTQFVDEFKQHLSRTYGRNVDAYENERVEVLGEREEARGDHTIKTRVARHDKDAVLVDYRLRRKDGAWKIIDIIVEGVSLISNFRSQFQEILAHGDPERLLRLLREKNIKSEPLTS